MILHRRSFIMGLVIALARPGSTTSAQEYKAQQPGKAWRIGVLSPGSPPPGPLEALRQGLRDLGYEDGRNVTIEWRFAGARTERLRDLAQELVRLKVDVIVAINTSASLAAKRATTTTPIVIARVSDPVRTGLVASFARPGGNITGLSSYADELSGKRLALTKEVLPTLSRLAMLWDAENPGIEVAVKEMERAGPQFGVQLYSHAVRTADDFRSAFEEVIRQRVNAVFVFDDVLLATHKRQILDWATKNRLPVMSLYAELAEAGGLMAYGPNIPDIYRRAATYVDKILKGAKPGDLPIDQPTKFDLVINVKSAKALSLTIPQSLLLRADQIIE